MQVSGPVKEDTVIGPKIAAVERREARVPVTTARGTSKRCQDVTSADPALRSLTCVREGKETADPTPTKSWGR